MRGSFTYTDIVLNPLSSVNVAAKGIGGQFTHFGIPPTRYPIVPDPVLRHSEAAGLPPAPWRGPGGFPVGGQNLCEDVDIYGTYRLREASIMKRQPGGGRDYERPSSMTNCTNPTDGMGILWFSSGRVSSVEYQV